MLISLAWIRSLVPVPGDAQDVARRLTSRGLTVDAVAAKDGDTIFDLDVPANRPDALGHLGVAREIAAAYGLTLDARAVAPQGVGADVHGSVAVAIEAPELCRRYTARLVRGVTVGPSPAWVVKRLEGVGVRSINNVVDASNLVMLELGQPVHFFDFATISSATIRVRLAALASIPSPAPSEFAWIDRYLGPPLNAGEVAMTLRVMLQPLDRTLTDGDVERYRAELVAALDSVPGVRLRRMDA